MKNDADILPDILAPDLKLVVCGTAAGLRSAQLGAYYAGPGNQFWPMLHRLGVTPALLRPAEFRAVIAYGVGLTDIVKRNFGADAVLRAADFDGEALHHRIAACRPRVLAFNGKRSAAAFFGAPPDYGYQPGRNIGETRIYVAPSTSGAARGFWDELIWRDVIAAAFGDPRVSTIAGASTQS